MTKGIGAIPFFMIIGVIAMVSAWLFFIFFKVHITSVAVDVDSVNRYQEVPTTLLADSVYLEDQTKAETGRGKPDKRAKDGINCFQGDGPMGAHGPNERLCTKPVSFLESNFLNGKSASLLGESAKGSGQFGVESLKDNLRLALPLSCYSLQISKGEKFDAFQDVDFDCSVDPPKLSESFPIPLVSSGTPEMGRITVVVGSKYTDSEALLVNWPDYDVRFEPTRSYGGFQLKAGEEVS